MGTQKGLSQAPVQFACLLLASGDSWGHPLAFIPWQMVAPLSFLLGKPSPCLFQGFPLKAFSDSENSQFHLSLVLRDTSHSQTCILTFCV